MSEDFIKVCDDLYAKGWTDGLPVIPPTKDRVAKMLEFTDRDPDDSLGRIPPSQDEAMVRSIAANAVMAGCKPEYFPVVVAAMEATVELPGLRIIGIRGEPLILCNGPIAKELGINSGQGLLGPNIRANITIGRTILLCLQNIGQSRTAPAEQGTPLRFATCLAEDEAGNPWEPLHVERGFASDTSTVSAKGGGLRQHDVPGGLYSGNFSQDLKNWAKILSAGTPHELDPSTDSLLAFSPRMAQYFANNGMSKDDLRGFLSETCRHPPEKDWYPDYPPERREIIVKSAFSPQPVWMRNVEQVRVFPEPKDIWFVVVGGGFHSYGRASSRDDKLITKPIAFVDGTPVKSVYDFKRTK